MILVNALPKTYFISPPTFILEKKKTVRSKRADEHSFITQNDASSKLPVENMTSVHIPPSKFAD